MSVAVRQGWKIVVPKPTKERPGNVETLTVEERFEKVSIAVRTFELDVSLEEASKFAQQIHHIVRRIRDRQKREAK